jgi:hypothetical protein
MLYPWQAAEIETNAQTPKRAIFASPRLGKTLVVLDSLDAMVDSLHRVLVTAPLGVCPMWTRLLADRGWRVIDAYRGPSRGLGARLEKSKGWTAVVINHERLGPGIDELLRWAPDAVIGDESHKFKAPASRRGRAFRRLCWKAKWVRVLTGTPAPNHYGDLWGQLVCLDKEEWGLSFERFAQRYLIRDSMFRSRVLGHRNVEELQARLLKYATIVRREDAFGPDSWQYVTREVDLPQSARRMYDELARQWFTEVSEGKEVSASHVLKRLIRLQQLAAGYLPTDEGGVVETHRAKIEAVLADLGEIMGSGEKAVLFYNFIWEGLTYEREIGRSYPVRRIGGDTSTDRRQAIIDEFAKVEGPMVAVVQVRSGGTGISFASASHALFVSRGFSFADDEQARDRVYARGAARCVTYYQARNTVDDFIAAVLSSKQDVHDAVTKADKETMAYGYINRKARA